MAIEHGHVEVLIEDLSIFDLVHVRRPALVDGRIGRLLCVGVAAEFQLVAIRIKVRTAVARNELQIDLAVVVLENRVVRIDGGSDGLADKQLDVLSRVRAPEPQLVFDDRAADRVDELDRIRL